MLYLWWKNPYKVVHKFIWKRLRSMGKHMLGCGPKAFTLQRIGLFYDVLTGLFKEISCVIYLIAAVIYLIATIIEMRSVNAVVTILKDATFNRGIAIYDLRNRS